MKFFVDFHPLKGRAQQRFTSIICDLSDPGGARTLDPLIKSQLLYQLSYGVNVFCDL